MTDSTELKRLADRVLTDRRFCGDENHKALADGVRALISENERLSKQWGDRPAYRTPEYESKRDAMWRRAHMVATSKGYDHINMAISAAPSACTDCMGCGGEWQGEGAPNSVCETCNGSRGKALEAERDQLKADNERLRADYAGLARFNPEWDRVAAAQDLVREHMAMVVQLKAEIAGLKTGYEAYERVNAELKAEVDGLRREREGKVLCDLELFETLRDSANTEADEHRQCMTTYRPLRQASLDSVVKKCDDLLSALGQGEQS